MHKSTSSPHPSPSRSKTADSQMSDPKIIVALDFDHRDACIDLVKQLDPSLCRLKVGKEMFTLFGPSLIDELHHYGFHVFLDLKFHDIPNTVNKAISAAASMGVWMVNVHASGGIAMMEAAKEALASYQQAPLLIAVTVLTSMNDQDLQAIGIVDNAQNQVLKLAALAADCELDGVVCSALEANGIKHHCGDSFSCITPGIRPLGSDRGDQQRIMTPEKALQNGSDYLVIGRPITQATSPIEAVKNITQAINRL